MQIEYQNGVAETTRYGFDGADRLTHVEYPEEIVDYGYDGVGNRLSETKTEKGSGNVLSAKTLAYNALNQLTAITDSADQQNNVTLNYDDNGNLVTKTTATGTTENLYDAQNRLVGVSAGGNTVASYAYDAEGLRIGKESLASTVSYVRDGLAVLTEYDAANTAIASYQYADGLLSLNSGAEGTAWYHNDTLGSPVVLTSNTGTQEASYKYEAFGLLREKTGLSYNSHLFTEKELDQETGLYYFGARYYDPEIGRFITQDTYLGDPNIPGSLHRYLYAYANPTVWTDPTGNYGVGGHYYTPFYIARRVGYSVEEAQKIAFFSMLPDAIGNLDAVAQSVQGTFGLGGATKEHRDTMMAGLHMLSDKESEPQTRLLRNVITAIPSTDLAALGLALHPLGDTFGHRRIFNENKTYFPVIGHGHHLTLPDQIHLRPELYADYVDNVIELLATHRGQKITRMERADIKRKLFDAVGEGIQAGLSGFTGPLSFIRISSQMDKQTVNALEHLVETVAPANMIHRPEQLDHGIDYYMGSGIGDEEKDVRMLIETLPMSNTTQLRATALKQGPKVTEEAKQAVERVLTLVFGKPFIYSRESGRTKEEPITTIEADGP